MVARVPIYSHVTMYRSRSVGNFKRVRVRKNRLSISTSMTMLRLYTPTLSLMWLSLLFVFPLLVYGHMIEVPASKKECFFEDLHVNDKVRQAPCIVNSFANMMRR